jgi:hypothetical protein
LVVARTHGVVADHHVVAVVHKRRTASSVVISLVLPFSGISSLLPFRHSGAHSCKHIGPVTAFSEW